MARNSPQGFSEEPMSRSGSDFPDNRFLELKSCRDAERALAVRQGLIPDPLKPRRLEEALPFLGTCLDMCPEFERHEREYQNNSDKWERYPGTSRIDPQKAVKAFHRPAAGNDQPLPSDVRPPDVLKSTLDYLFKILLAKESLYDTHGFIRDRTRSIRQDFTLQNERGPVAIECHERIARYHILCLHFLRDKEGVGSYQEQQELEQFRKVLQSLNEFYDDYRGSNCFWPNEAEFRAYYLLTHLRDSDAARATERLPEKVFNDERIQSALQLQILAQCGNMSRAPGRRTANSPATLNAFTRLFKKISSPHTSFFNACLLETDFREIRVSALKALRSAQSIKYGAHVPLVEISRLCSMSLEECHGFCKACGLTISKGNFQECTVELHKHAPFEDKPVAFRTLKSPFITAKVTNRSVVDLIDGVRAAALIGRVVPLTPAPVKPTHRPPAISLTPTLFPSPLSNLSFKRNSITTNRSVFSPKKADPILVSPASHSTPLRDQQITLKSQRSGELGLSRERTRCSSSIKIPHGLPSSSISTSPGFASSKKAPQKLLPVPSSIPPSPLAAQPSPTVPINYDAAVASLKAAILSGIVESSISRVARETLRQRSMQAFADEKRKNDYIVSHFTQNLEALLLSEFVYDVVFDLTSSSLLSIRDNKQQRLLLKATFRKWRDTTRLRKSRLNWKGSNSTKDHNLVNDLSSIWAPGGLKAVVTQYLYRKALIKREPWSKEIEVLMITPVESSVVQAWLCCKFEIQAGQRRSRSSINGLSISFELVDQSVDLLSLDIARFAMILVWLDVTDRGSPFLAHLISILRTPSFPSTCCLGISWQSQPSHEEVDHFMDEWDVPIHQVYLSLDSPEVKLEKALQDYWPLPSASAALSANNADRLSPLTHVWKRMQRKVATLFNAYVPSNDSYILTNQTKSVLQKSLLQFTLDLLQVLSKFVALMVHPPEIQDDDGLVSYVIKTLGMELLTDKGSTSVDQLLHEYQASLPLNTFSLNLSLLLESRVELSLVDFFQLFGQYLFTAWLDCIIEYLSQPESSQEDQISFKTRFLLPPHQLDHHQSELERSINSTFQHLHNQIVTTFPKPLSIINIQNDDHMTIGDETKIDPTRGRQKLNSVAELRLLISQTRESLRISNRQTPIID